MLFTLKSFGFGVFCFRPVEEFEDVRGVVLPSLAEVLSILETTIARNMA